MEAFALIVSLAVFGAVPGALVAFVSGVRPPVALVAAAPVTLGMAGIGAWVLGAAGIPWGPGGGAAVLAVFVVLAFCWRTLLARRGARTSDREPAPPTPRREWTALWPAVVGVVTGAGLIAGSVFVRFRRVAADGDVTPHMLWDAQWHANVLRWIEETGIASSTRAGELDSMEGAKQLYYPFAWHEWVAIPARFAGAHPIAAFNLALFATVAVAVPTGAAVLAWRLGRDTGTPDRAAWAAGVAAVLVASLPAAAFTGIFLATPPFSVAQGFAPVAAVLMMSVPGDHRRGFAAVLAFVGVGLTHPSGAVTAAVLVTLWWLGVALRHPRRSRIVDSMVLSAAGAGAAALVLPQWLAGASQGDEILATTLTVETSRAGSLWMAMFQQTLHADTLPVPVLVLALAVIGLVFLAAHRTWWPLALYVLFVVTLVNALVPFTGVLRGVGSAIALFGGLYYNTPTRLSFVLALVIAAFAGVGAVGLASVRRGWVRAGPAGRGPMTVPRRGFPVGFGVAILAVAVAVGVWKAPGNSALAVEKYSDGPVDARDRRAFAWLARQPHIREGVVYFDPAEGAGWMYAAEGIPTVFHHYQWSSSPLVDTVWQHAPEIGANREVDDAVARLGVRFLYISPPSYWPHQPTFEHFARGTFNAPGLVPVYRDHQVSILAVRAAFTAEEIAAMQASAAETIARADSRGAGRPGAG